MIMSCSQLRHALRVWRRLSAAALVRRTAAAVRIQSWFRTRQCVRRFPLLLAATRFHLRLLLARAWVRWMRRRARLARWRRICAARPRAVSVASFPARRWRAEEGTMVMAQQYYRWRCMRMQWRKWMMFMTESAHTTMTRPSVSWR
jgi:hypothetical protein